jgi:hypothetical protein
VPKNSTGKKETQQVREKVTQLGYNGYGKSMNVNLRRNNLDQKIK